MKSLLLTLVTAIFLLAVSTVHAQGLNVASTYTVGDNEAISGDIIVSDSAKGLTRSDVSYDNRIFGVLQAEPLLVLREASDSGQAVIRGGDTEVNISDFNGDIKKGDFVTTSPVAGKGMKAGQSGYALGLATEDARYIGPEITVNNKKVKTGIVKVAIRIEYAEITTARNNIRLLQEINAAIFRNVKDPEKFILVLRYILGGLVAMLAFGIGFYSVSRSVSNAVVAIGRNPLAKKSILFSVGLHLIITFIAALALVVVIFIIIRL